MPSEIARRNREPWSRAARLGAIAARALVASIVALAPTSAGAEPSPADKAVAEALFRDGKQLIEAGKLNEGCSKLEESQRIDPKLGTLLNLATCHEQLGRTASAWAEFNEAAPLANTAKQSARASFAKAHAEALERRLSKLTLKVASPPEGLAITLNGKDLSTAALGSPIPVDPGELAVTATAPGKKMWSQRLTIAEGPVSSEIVIPALEAEAPAPAAIATPPPSPPPTAPPSGAPQRAIGIAVAGVGLVSVGLGSYFGVHAFQQNDAYKGCGDCDYLERRGRYDDASRSATISTITFIAGLGCIAGGAALFFTAPSPKPGRTALRALPLIGPNGLGISLGGTLE